MFTEYIDWRAEHPSDDLMTALLTAEFEDENGEMRRLTREEVLTYVTVVAGAGNETTTRLIGWAGKVLADFPDERRLLVEDPSLIPNAIEELLRFEPPAPHAARYVTKDVEYYGRTVPAGSVMLLLMGSANRDERKFADPDQFDVDREVARPHRLRLRPALLPGRRTGPARGPHRARGGPQAVPGVDRRHESGPAVAHVHGAGLGDPPRHHPLAPCRSRWCTHVMDSEIHEQRARDKVAIVTGGANGIGRAISELFVEEGARVVIADIDDEAASEVADGLGETTSFVHTDVSEADGVQAAIEHAQARFACCT